MSRKSIFYRHLNFNTRILAGLCFGVVISNCDDEPSSGNSGRSSIFKSERPDTDVDSLENVLSQEMDKTKAEFLKTSKDACLNNLRETLKLYEDMSSTLSKEKVEQILKENHQNSVKLANGDEEKYQEHFKLLSKQVSECTIAIFLFSQGKERYSQKQERDLLYKDISKDFIEMWKKDNSIDKKQTVEVILHRIKVANEKGLRTLIQKIFEAIGGLNQDIAASLTEVIGSLNKLQEDAENRFNMNQEGQKTIKESIEESIALVQKSLKQQTTIRGVLENIGSENEENFSVLSDKIEKFMKKINSLQSQNSENNQNDNHEEENEENENQKDGEINDVGKLLGVA